MNQSHYTFETNGHMLSKWADNWSDILTEYPNAILRYQMS